MKEKILTALRESDGYVSGQELCQKLGVSRTAVWKAINSLKEAGYEIEAVTNRGYRICSAPDVLSKEELISIQKTKWIGQELYYYSSLDSTNNKAKELGDNGSINGTVVVADQQTAGRGRRGRSWETPLGDAIAVTIMLKPEMNPGNASMLTLVAALAVSKAIEEVTGEIAGIKWPNDLIMDSRKVCGILTEMSAQFDYINHIVIGIGINVHTKEFPEELKEIATSIYKATGQTVRRADLIERILEWFENYYEIFMKTEDLSQLVREYNSLLVNKGRTVRVLDPKEPFEGKAMGITERGELIVDTWESRRLVSSGEVSVRGLHGYTE